MDANSVSAGTRGLSKMRLAGWAKPIGLTPVNDNFGEILSSRGTLFLAAWTFVILPTYPWGVPLVYVNSLYICI